MAHVSQRKPSEFIIFFENSEKIDKVVGFEPTIITYVNTTLPNS